MRHVSPKLQGWLNNYNRFVKELVERGFVQTPAIAREGMAKLTREFVTDSPEIAWVQDDLVNAPDYAIPVRIYHPMPDAGLPVLVYYHGGGHMAGSVDVYDPICRKVAHAAEHIVVSVEYRLAPEHPYPCGVNDAHTVIKNVWTTLDGQGINYERRLSFAGDSGGGALCATVSHISQYDAAIDIRRQAMIYPSLDYTLTSESIEENAKGYLLEKEKIIWYFDNYFQMGEDRKSASPLHMDFTNRLPETLVITAGFCPLRDEGIAYVEKVKSTGLYVEHLHFDNMIHAFLNLENLVKDECETVYRKIGKFLNMK